MADTFTIGGRTFTARPRTLGMLRDLADLSREGQDLQVERSALAADAIRISQSLAELEAAEDITEDALGRVKDLMRQMAAKSDTLGRQEAEWGLRVCHAVLRDTSTEEAPTVEWLTEHAPMDEVEEVVAYTQGARPTTGGD